jgi:fibronectin type 3 domain-containing protein
MFRTKLIFFLCLSFSSLAQINPSVLADIQFSQLPQNLHFFAQNTTGKATVPIAGRNLSGKYTAIRSILYKNGQISENKLITIKKDEAFALSHLIQAELSNYHLKVYLKTNTDSLLAAEANKMLCGDVFVVYGQSNAAAPNYGAKLGNEFCRSFGGNNPLVDDLKPYNPADTLFGYADDERMNPGTWMSQLMTKLVEKHKTPILAINGAVYGAGISTLTNKENGLMTPYDKLFYRVKKAGFQKQVKAIFYRQGETDVQLDETSLAWKDHFKKLHGHLQQDFGATPIYLAQLDISVFSAQEAGFLRDFQRQAERLLPNVHSYTLSGSENFDGLHYSPKGHIDHAAELEPIISKELYNTINNSSEIYSPRLQKAYYKDASKKTIIVLFDEEQNLSFSKEIYFYSAPQNTALLKTMASNFLVNNAILGKIDRVSAQNNELHLDLNNTQNISTITYLPSSFNLSDTYYFPGPFLKNSLGMRAFTFYKQPIGAAMGPLQQFAASNTSKRGQVILQWKPLEEATNYQIFRKNPGQTEYKPIAIATSPNAATYIDSSLVEGHKYLYKIRAHNATAASNVLFAEVTVSDFSQPTGLLVKAEDAQNQSISWQDNAIDESEYILEISTKEDFANATKISLVANSSSYQNTGLEASKKYYYRLRAWRNTAGLYTAYSTIASATTCPLAPANLVLNIFENTYQLRWVDRSPDEIAFVINATPAGAGSTVSWATAPDALTANLLGLKDGSQYSIQVFAKNAEGCSSAPALTQLLTPLTAPLQLAALGTAIDKIQLTWTDPSQAEEIVEVYEIQDDKEVQIAELPANTTSYTVANLLPGSTHQYRIRNKNQAAGTSGFTSITKANTLLITAAEPLKGQIFNVFPNPFKNQISIKVAQILPNAQCTIFSITGKQLLQIPLKNTTTTVDIGHLVGQKYVVIIENGQQKTSLMLLKN